MDDTGTVTSSTGDVSVTMSSTDKGISSVYDNMMMSNN